MARHAEPSAEDVAGWTEWVQKQPPEVAEILARFEPWSLFRMKDTGQRVVIVGCDSNRKLIVHVSGRFNLVTIERNVFGVDPDNLEPCELPPPNEPVGAFLTDADAEVFIRHMRERVLAAAGEKKEVN